MEHVSSAFKKSADKFAKTMIKKQYPNLENKEFDIRKCKLNCDECGEGNLVGYEIKIKGKNQWRKVPMSLKKCLKCQDRELAEEARAIHKRQRGRRFWKPNDELDGATFETFEPQDEAQARALKTAVQYVKDFKNGDKYNLVFRGPYGAGKSHLAKSIGEELKKEGYAVGFVTTEELLTMIKGTWKESQITEEQLLAKMNGNGEKEPGVDLLILDELGAETSTGEWAKNKIISIVNSRQGKQTIYTTNESDESLANLFTGRVVSRLNNNTKFEEVNTDIDMRMDKRR